MECIREFLGVVNHSVCYSGGRNSTPCFCANFIKFNQDVGRIPGWNADCENICICFTNV